MEEIVLDGSELDTAGTARSCGHGNTGNADIPAPDGKQWHSGPKMKAVLLTSDVPGPFGSSATDGASGTACGAAGGFLEGGLAMLWGYLPASDDRVWVLGRTTSD